MFIADGVPPGAPARFGFNFWITTAMSRALVSDHDGDIARAGFGFLIASRMELGAASSGRIATLGKNSVDAPIRTRKSPDAPARIGLD
jgi:hypothetical protein